MEGYLTTKDYAEKIGASVLIVQRLCKNERIPGAIKFGRDWLIPEDAKPIPSKKGPLAEWEKKLARSHE